MIFESDKNELSVYYKDKLIAEFHNGKYETSDEKTIEILNKLEGVEEAVEDLKGEDFFDKKKFEKKITNDKEAIHYVPISNKDLEG